MKTKMDRMFAKYVRMYGWNATIRYCQNLGISFEDCYFMAFGREARRTQK